MNKNDDSAAHAPADPKKLYAERERRFADAIALKEPDRVPISYTS